MSVAATTTTERNDPSQPMSLMTASFFGAIFVLASLAVVLFAVPQVWQSTLGGPVGRAIGQSFSEALLIFFQLAVLVALVFFGRKLVGENAPVGLAGGVTLTIATLVVGFFLIKWFVSTLERMSTRFELGQVISLLFFGFLLYLFYKYLISDRMARWSVALDNAGWFDAKPYKRNQGVRVRRFTMLGIFLVFGSGIYTMIHNHVISSENWVVSIPFAHANITLLPNIKMMVPIVLSLLTIWFAWRVVNFPTFADFLIATEAEINKVSWTPRPKLLRDTVVVLTTVLLITLFLFVVDIFWGFALSRSWIGVLPSDDEQIQRTSQQVNPNEW